MAKKERRSGLGKGLDSLIPKIEETEVEEGISLEDILKKSEEKSEDTAKDDEVDDTLDEIADDTEDETVDDAEDDDEIIFDEEPDEDDKELIFPEDEDESEEKILVEESDVEKYVEEIAEEEVSEDDYLEDTSIYTTVFHNDDEKIADENDGETAADLGVKNIDSAINLNEEEEETTKIIDDSVNLKEGTSFLTEKEEKLIDEVIETVENNPRITLWSARSAAVLRYLRKTEPEFSISSEASNLIDAAIAEKYPEIWTLFNHLWLST